MPPVANAGPISAFSVYRKTTNKSIVKKKKPKFNKQTLKKNQLKSPKRQKNANNSTSPKQQPLKKIERKKNKKAGTKNHNSNDLPLKKGKSTKKVSYEEHNRVEEPDESYKLLIETSTNEVVRKVKNPKRTKKQKNEPNDHKSVETTLNEVVKKNKNPKPPKKDEDEPPKLVEIDFNNISNENLNLQHANPESDNPILEAQQLFDWLIAPLPQNEFFETYWEQKPVHVRRTDPNYYAHILNSAGLDKIIRNHSLFYTRNIDVVSYQNGVKEVHNQEGKAVPSAVWDYYSNGCSIRVLNPHSYNNKVHLLLSTLQEFFGTMVGANVYLTPPGSQGFAPHFDDIEAFVVQLEGRKHWKLYQPKDSDELARYSSPNFQREDLGEPFMSLTLNAGEVLYFPRGIIHEGCTDEDSHSLHITVSVYQQTSYADLLENIVMKSLKNAVTNNIEFRRGLPLNYLKQFGAVTSDYQYRNGMVNHIKYLMHSLVDYIDIDNAADQLGRKFMYDSMPPLVSKSEACRTARRDGPYIKNGKIINRVEISLDTKIRLLRYYCIRLVCDDSEPPKLYYNTENAKVYHEEEEQWLELQPSMIPLISMLQTSYPNYVEVEHLPMDDVALKMGIISDLWEHGLLVTQETLECIDDDNENNCE